MGHSVSVAAGCIGRVCTVWDYRAPDSHCCQVVGGDTAPPGLMPRRMFPACRVLDQEQPESVAVSVLICGVDYKLVQECLLAAGPCTGPLWVA
jgi:hypothetical protein